MSDKKWCAMCGKWGDHQSGTCPELHPSELATSESAGPVPVVAAVATGSLLVSSAEALANRWEKKAKAILDYCAHHFFHDTVKSAEEQAKADQLKQAANELRQLARESQRQPEENTTMSNAPAPHSPNHNQPPKNHE